MQQQLIEYRSVSDGAVAIILNDAKSMNALSLGLVDQLVAALTRASDDGGVKTLILTGTGRGFCSGGHKELLRERPHASRGENIAILGRISEVVLKLYEFPGVTIAALNGDAFGGGASLALACDLRVASINARLGFNYLRLGLHPGLGASFFLPRIVGHAVAAELFFTARTLEADECLAHGLVSRIVKPDELWSAATDLAGSIAAHPVEAIRELRDTFRHGHLSLKETLDREIALQAEGFYRPAFARAFART